MLRRIHVERVLHQVDAFALAEVFRLDDEGFFCGGAVCPLDGRVAMHDARILFKLGLELHVLDWQHVRLGKDIVLLRKALVHLHQATRQLLLVRDHTDSGKLRNPLVRLQLGKHFGQD